MKCNKIRVMIMGFIVLVVFSLAGCGGGGDSSVPPPSSNVSNAPPVANAGIAQSVSIGTLVAIDGSTSSDANTDPLTYNWSFASRPSSSSAALSSITVAKPTFTADVGGVYVLKLIVNDGKFNSAASTVTITVNDPSAPSIPTGLRITNITANSVSISWNASTGGNGGVYAYKIYRNGVILQDGTKTWVSTMDKTKTTYTDIGNLLQPATSYSYTIVSSSFAGNDSVPSVPVITTTLSASEILNKLSPYIYFDTATGKIRTQLFVSPGMISKVYPNTGTDLIAHTRVDPTLYKVTSLGGRKYTLTNISTGLPFESPIDAPTFTTSSGYGAIYVVNMSNGTIIGSMVSPANALFLNMEDGQGAYLQGEIL